MLVALLCGLAVAARANATTVVILITTDRVVVAADSKVSVLQGGTPGMVLPSTCKIHFNADTRTAFLAAGPITGGGFDFITPGVALLENRDSTAEKYADLFYRIANASTLPSTNGLGALEIGFVAWENSRVQLAIGKFVQRQLPHCWSLTRSVSENLMTYFLTSFDQVGLDVCVGRFCRAVRVLGIATRIDVEALEARLKQRPKEDEMVRLAVDAVQTQIDATSDVVGGPISSIVIDKRGARWVRQPELCKGPEQ